MKQLCLYFLFLVMCGITVNAVFNEIDRMSEKDRQCETDQYYELVVNAETVECLEDRNY